MRIAEILDDPDRRSILIAHNVLLYASDVSVYRKAMRLNDLLIDYEKHIYRRSFNFGEVREIMLKLLKSRYYPIAYVLTDDGEYLVRLSFLKEFSSKHEIREVVARDRD